MTDEPDKYRYAVLYVGNGDSMYMQAWATRLGQQGWRMKFVTDHYAVMEKQEAIEES